MKAEAASSRLFAFLKFSVGPSKVGPLFFLCCLPKNRRLTSSYTENMGMQAQHPLGLAKTRTGKNRFRDSRTGDSIFWERYGSE